MFMPLGVAIGLNPITCCSRKRRLWSRETGSGKSMSGSMREAKSFDLSIATALTPSSRNCSRRESKQSLSFCCTPTATRSTSVRSAMRSAVRRQASMSVFPTRSCGSFANSNGRRRRCSTLTSDRWCQSMYARSEPTSAEKVLPAIFSSCSRTAAPCRPKRRKPSRFRSWNRGRSLASSVVASWAQALVCQM